jgi:transcriptional regulator with XRE-family HTH domain
MGEKISNKLIKEELKKLYYEQNKSLEDIAKEYGRSRGYISRIMEKYGLERRTKSEARIEAIKKGKFERFEYDDINENFFIGWSPGMAWILGLLFTDGTIDNTRVAINSVDIELLEKIKKLINSSKPIQKKTQSYDKSKHISEFTFFREKMREDLNRLGLHQRKSLTMIFPDVPKKYMRHFIRGCWDGDGSVFISGGKMNANYTCGSLKFIERLVQELYKVGVHKRRLPLDKTDADRMWSNYPIGKYPLAIHKEKRSKSYNIKIDSKDNLEKLFHYFYDDVDESIYLLRKFKTFAKGLKLPEGAETEQLNLDLSF